MTRFLGHSTVSAKIECLSGLHIGAGKDTIEIGGIDNPVVKKPYSNEPYIPGSSLKGKLRFLLEWGFGHLRKDGKPWGFNDKDPAQTAYFDDRILRIFGGLVAVPKQNGDAIGPTRLIVRDARLDENWRDDVLSKGHLLTEEKAEVAIDRISGSALTGGLRHTERVPQGARFDLEMVFRLYDTGDGGVRDVECLNWLIASLWLLELDALGGSGSRGYGRVEFHDIEVRDPSGKLHRPGRAPFGLNRFPTERAPEILPGFELAA